MNSGMLVSTSTQKVRGTTAAGVRGALVLAALAVSISLSISPALGRKPPAGPNADSLHWAAWDSVVSLVDIVPAARYSFYAYRSLAVPCPEIYLRADALFSDIVAQIPGSRAGYTERDPRNLDLYRRLRHGKVKGSPFRWGDRVIDPRAISDSAAGLEPASWLDRRIPSAAVLLKSETPNLSTLEAASLLYTQFRQMGRSDSALFVIVDSMGHGHLAGDGSLISLETGSPLESGLAGVRPVLVFNERVVFYPLLGRDDRGSDLALQELVSQMAPPSAPVLSLLDRLRLEKLTHLARLPSEQSRGLATIAACGAVGMYNPVLQEAWRLCSPDTGDLAEAREHAMVRSAVYWANMLCRSVARLAAAGGGGEFAERTALWQGSFLQRCGRSVTIDGQLANPERLEAWGNLWAERLLEISFDDIIRTKAGTGSSQTLAMSAALDMVKRPNFRLEIDLGEEPVSDQTWLIADNGKWQFNLGSWTRLPDSPPMNMFKSLLTLSISMGGEWFSMSETGIESDADNLTVASVLTEVQRQIPSATLRFLAPEKHTYGVGQILMKLESGEWPLRPFPWPGTGIARELAR